MNSKQTIAVGTLLSKAELTSWNYVSILTLLKERQGTSTQLATLMGISTAAMTGLTTKLAEKNYLASTRSEKDRRVYHLRITPQGRAFLTSIYDASHT